MADVERTEAPTARRLAEARERGEVPRSREAASAAALLGAAAALAWQGPAMAAAMGRALRHAATLAADPTPWTLGDAATQLAGLVADLLRWAGPVAAAVWVASVVALVAQGGVVLALEPLAPRPARIDPVAGLRRWLSPTALGELAKLPVKLVVLSAVAVLTLSGTLPAAIRAAGGGPVAVLDATAAAGLTLLWRLGAVAGALGAADWALLRWQHRRRLRMTRAEVRDELRQTEGDPGVRARLRRLHRRLVGERRMLREVSRAHVVVTNPTTLAVALRYDPPTMRAPRVVAKGAGPLAARLREQAWRSGIPIVRQPGLAQALWRAVPVGREIPVALYLAVAEVLAMVWKLSRPRGAA
jgi:flagellar biosynthetic protein FlhB